LTLDCPGAANIWMKIDEAGPGDEVMLPFPPKFLNVSLQEPTSELEKLSVVSGETVIPLMMRNRNARKVINAKKVKSIHRSSLESTKLQYFDFGIDLAFAVTYHKVQGRTLDRVIIDLNSVQYLTVAAIYVSISRTRKQDHIRFLSQSGGIISTRKLLKKEFNRDLVKWIAMNESDDVLLQMILKWKPGNSNSEGAAPEILPCISGSDLEADTDAEKMTDQDDSAGSCSI